MLLNRLQKHYGLSGKIIEWIKSYLSKRSFVVTVKGDQSECCELGTGVPQGSILGPLLFILYTKGLQDIVEQHGLQIHLYADDTQVYFSFDPANESGTAHSKETLQRCFKDIKQWMANNHLKLNDGKSKLIEFPGNSKFSCQPSYQLDQSCFIKPASSAKSLGYMFDSKLNLDVQINNVIRICYINQRNIGRIGSKLNQELKVQLVNAFIHSILDNGNSTYGALTAKQLTRLQKVQNSAVRFIFGLYGKRKREPLSPYMRQLHFLPVAQRIKFKIALLVFKCFNNCAPDYMRDMITCRNISNHQVRLDMDYYRLQQPSSPRLRYTRGAFSHTAPRIWNALPYHLRSLTSIETFKSNLKTYLFNEAYPDDV